MKRLKEKIEEGERAGSDCRSDANQSKSITGRKRVLRLATNCISGHYEMKTLNLTLICVTFLGVQPLLVMQLAYSNSVSKAFGALA